MGERLNGQICDGLNTTFPLVTEAEKCGRKSNWKDLEGKVGEVCAVEREGGFLVQGVQLLCADKDTFAGQLMECDGDGGAAAVENSGSISVVRSVADGSTSATASDSSTISLANHGVADANPGTTLTPMMTPSTGIATSSFTVDGSPASPAITATSLSTVSSAGSSSASANLPQDPDVPVITITASAPYTLATTNIPTPASQNPTSTSLSFNGLATTWTVGAAFPLPTGYSTSFLPASLQSGQLSHYPPSTGLGYPARGAIYMQPNELAFAVARQVWDIPGLGLNLYNHRVQAEWTECFVLRELRGLWRLRRKVYCYERGYKP
jgi:hypothetical protein